jgi:hypothetical protein
MCLVDCECVNTAFRLCMLIAPFKHSAPIPRTLVNISHYMCLDELKMLVDFKGVLAVL